MNNNIVEEEEAALVADAEWEPDLHWLTNDLAVGGCFPAERAADLADRHGVGAVVDLRSEEHDNVELLDAAGIAFLHLPTPDMQPSELAMLDRGVLFARQHISRGQKVLIHCQHGIGRSAVLALCVLVDQGLEPLEAIQTAKDKRGKISPSASQFEGWASWLKANGHTVPDAHTFGCIAYRQLSGP